MYRDRVKDTTTSTGTGAITLAGVAPTGYQTFATAFGASPITVAYCIADQSGANWEVGTGTFNGTTGLTRVTVLGSSNAGSLVNFGAGTKDVFCTAPAAYLLPPGANTQVGFNNAGLPGANANFTYNLATNTLTTGNITGSALGMTIQPKAPLVTELSGDLSFLTRNAAIANGNSGNINFTTGTSLGTGEAGTIFFSARAVQFTMRTVTSGAAGNLQAAAGQGVTAGGSFIMSGGRCTGAGGTAGGFTLNGGNASNATGIPGGVQLNAGFNENTGFGAKIELVAGAGTAITVDDDSVEPRVGFFAATPAVQQTTATASATRAAVTGTTANVGDTYDSYTLAQVVKALRNYGLLA